jgi:cytoskeletal protein RodZ
MGDFGSDLRIEREKCGVSLEQIAQSTKVSVRHLRALEEQRFDLLPGGIFNRGILRGYLRCLSLDEAPWIARFAAAYQPHATDNAHENEWLSYAEKSTGIKPSPAGADQLRFRWIGVLILLIVLAITAWLVWRFAAKRFSHPAPVTQLRQNARLYSGYVFLSGPPPPDGQRKVHPEC